MLLRGLALHRRSPLGLRPKSFVNAGLLTKESLLAVQLLCIHYGVIRERIGIISLQCIFNCLICFNKGCHFFWIAIFSAQAIVCVFVSGFVFRIFYKVNWHVVIKILEMLKGGSRLSRA